MQSIEINGRKVLLDIVNNDSGEFPESACTNRLIGVRIGDVTYQYLNTEPAEAIRAMAADIAADTMRYGVDHTPDMLTVVITHFDKRATINWAASVSATAKMHLLAKRVSS